MKNLPQRWITIVAKKSSTLHRCTEFTKWPNVLACHQVTPPRVSTSPEAMMTTRLARQATPKT